MSAPHVPRAASARSAAGASTRRTIDQVFDLVCQRPAGSCRPWESALLYQTHQVLLRLV